MSSEVQTYNSQQVQTIKNTICKNVSDDELQIFLHACKRTGLDPFMRQIYAVPRYDRASNKNVMTVQTGIDGYRLIAERTGRYAPGKEPTYTYDSHGQIVSATAYVKKMTSDGTWHEVAATAYWNEYCPTTKDGKPTKFWAEKPHLMIAKCSEGLALRKAFPAELSGIYTDDEMAKAKNDAGSKGVKDDPIEAIYEEEAMPSPVDYTHALRDYLPPGVSIEDALAYCKAVLQRWPEGTLDRIIKSIPEQKEAFCTKLLEWLNKKAI